MVSVQKEMLSPLSKDTPMAVRPCLRASDTWMDKLDPVRMLIADQEITSE